MTIKEWWKQFTCDHDAPMAQCGMPIDHRSFDGVPFVRALQVSECTICGKRLAEVRFWIEESIWRGVSAAEGETKPEAR